MIILTILAVFIISTLIANTFFKRFKISYWSASLAALLISVVFGIVSLNYIGTTLVGNYYIQPWKVLIIFFCVAYIAISVDATGLFKHFAYKIIHHSKSTSRLFLLFFFLAGILTMLTSNDVVILTLTPIIIELRNFAKINIMPLLFAEFIAANTFSMIFYTGDPTNIIVANASNLGFFEFAKYMLIPTIVAVVAVFVGLRFVFRKDLKDKISVKHNKRDHVKSWLDAKASVAILLAMLFVLVISQKIDVEVWNIVAFFAVVAILKDLYFGLIKISPKTRYYENLKMMPWKILPFIIFFFVFVNKLNETTGLYRLASVTSATSKPSAIIMFLGGVSALLANTINNQPATILMTNVAIKSGIITAKNSNPAALAIVLATSIGGSITIIGTLAGVMWQNILHYHGVDMSYLRYLKTSIKVVPLALAMGLVALMASIAIFGI